MAQGVAWMAREIGVPATIVVPHNASMSKLAAVERLGGRIERRSWDEWWSAMEAGSVEGIDGFFVHPVRDDPVIAGNGTIGLELVEDLDDFDAVLIPWGGGGLTTGIASAVKQLRPDTDIYVCEPETGAPVTAAIANGRTPTKIEYDGLLDRRRRIGCAPPGDVGARGAARDGRVRDHARGCGGRGADARRTRTRRRRGCGGTPGRGGDGRPRRQRPRRLHRLGREHRPDAPCGDPRRSRSGLVDESSLEPGEALALECRQSLVPRVEREQGGEHDREHTCSQPSLLVDRAVLREERRLLRPEARRSRRTAGRLPGLRCRRHPSR